MALTIDPALKRITVPQADATMSLVSGTLYELDTKAFKEAVMDLLASEAYIWMDDALDHTGEKVLGSETFARFVEMINSWTYTFENTSMSVQMAGSNNNLFDSETPFLVNQSLVNVIGRNSAGLIVTTSGASQQSLMDY